MIKKEDVLKAYSGHPGCACGCLGKYYYRKTTQELGTKDRGYLEKAAKQFGNLLTLL